MITSFRTFITKRSSHISSLQSMHKRKIKVYTKTGDKGTSSLYNLERRSKSDPIFEALGDTDELNACIGVAREYCMASNNGLNEKLIEIQSRLMDIGSAIATPLSSSKKAKTERVEFNEANVGVLESWIDEMDETLPALRNFILQSAKLPCSI